MAAHMSRLSISDAEFRALAARASEMAAEYLAGIDRMPAFPKTSGRLTEELFGQALPEQGMGAAALDALPQVAEQARPENGRFFGYVLGSGEPVAALGDFFASVLNQNVTAWRSGPAFRT